MEILVSIVSELAKCILSPVCKYCIYHKDADEYMRILKGKFQYLDCLKLDIVSRMEAQLTPKKTKKAEVERWLQDIEKMDVKIRDFEAIESKFFLRGRVGKHALKMIKEVEELYQRGNFTDSLVIDRNGEILPTPRTLRGGRTIERIKREVLACMFDDDVRKIGVYGMVGIGKSTIMGEIHKSLLEKKHKFDIVVLVTVSETFNVLQLQNDIASPLGLDLQNFDNVETRAAKLIAKLKHKRFVLILDDVWETFNLEDIGIPEPTYANECKLILTTPSLDVCQRMSCKGIKMELLSEEEVQNLFVESMGRDVFKIPHLKPTVQEVLRQCAQMPPAIVHLAHTCRDFIQENQWKETLEKLRKPEERIKFFSQIVGHGQRQLERYKFLKGENLNLCILHCALYPKGIEINEQDVIEHLIDEGIIERMESRQAKLDRGYSMLKELENDCLLESGINKYEEKFMKVHDIIRDVLHVASTEFIVGHLGLEDFLDEGKWGENFVKASLMYNNISRIPPDVSPRYPDLSILLLCGNQSLKNVPDSLFVHLCGLKVLDLSHTAIESLPNSIFRLENLTTLRLRGCRNLKLVPSLAKLVTLEKLDLGQTGITEVPHDLKMLVNLRYLSLNASELKIMPPGILPELSRLQYLTVFWHSKSVIVEEKEIESLKKLETFGGHFNDMDEFSKYIKSLEERPLACYEIRVGMSGDGNYRIGEIFGKSVILGDCIEESFVLPKDVQYLEIKRCHNLRSLYDVTSLTYTSEIKHIGIFLCTGMDHILSFASSSSSCTHSLQTLEILELYNLDNLLDLFRKENPRVPRDTFSCLKRILICNCPKIKKLLPPGLLLHLHNLEEIRVSFCEKLKKIAEEEEEGMDTNLITLPRLRILHLFGLPELKTICSSKKIVCNSLEKIEIRGCPKFKRLPLFLPLLNGQLSPPPYLQKIETTEEWWESLEWEHRNTKNVLQPFFRKL